MLSAAEACAVREVRAGDPERWTWKALAAAFGVTRYQIEKALTPETVAKRNQRNARAAERPAEEVRDLGREKAIRLRARQALDDDPRDLTGRFLGDPLPGRSALDQRRGSGLGSGGCLQTQSPAPNHATGDA